MILDAKRAQWFGQNDAVRSSGIRCSRRRFPRMSRFAIGSFVRPESWPGMETKHTGRRQRGKRKRM